jgi:antitoxin VapB
MTRSSIFIDNDGQAVRLPESVAFPENVREIEIRVIGSSRLITPVGKRWDDYFLHGSLVSADFMTERVQPAAEKAGSSLASGMFAQNVPG